MLMLTVLVWAAQQGTGDGKAEVKAELDRFKVSIRSTSEPARISAIQSLPPTVCAEAIGPLATLLTGDSEGVRVAAANALSRADHPKSVEVLVAALPSNESPRPVFEAIVKALQVLDCELCAEALNGLLSKYHEKEVQDGLPAVIPALAALGSPTSVDPLLRLLEHLENEGKGGRAGKLRAAGNPKLLALEAPVKAALQAITGGNEPNCRLWKQWWTANRERLLESAFIVYRCKSTGKRWQEKAGEPEACPYHDKIEKDGQVVKTLLRARP